MNEQEASAALDAAHSKIEQLEHLNGKLGRDRALPLAAMLLVMSISDDETSMRATLDMFGPGDIMRAVTQTTKLLNRITEYALHGAQVPK